MAVARRDVDASEVRVRATGWRTWVAALVLAVACAPAGAGAQAPADLAGKRVLLLFSYHPTFVTSQPILRTLLSALEPRGVALDVEYMDSKRHPDAVAQDSFAAGLAHRLSARRPYDVVLASDDNALRFARAHRTTVLRGAPVVFLAVNDLATAFAMDRDPHVTGVVEHVSLAETVRLAHALDPGLREVVAVVDGTPSGRGDEQAFRALGPELDGVRLRVLSAADRSWDELAVELAALDSDRAVLRLALFRDARGTVRSFASAIGLLVEHAPVPVYALRKHGIGIGTAGGVVVDFEAQAREAARLALAILEGAPAASLPVTRDSPNVTTVDARVLERFAIPLSRVPAGSVVINPPSDAPRAGLAPALLAVVGLLSLLVMFLVVQVVRRRRAEALAHQGRERFRSMVEGSLHGVLIHRNRVPVFANQAYADILGYDSPEELLALGDVERFYAAHEHARLRGYQEARVGGRDAPSEYDFEAVRKDGSIVVLHNVVHRTRWNGEVATQHNVVDVTARAHAARLLRESEERYRSLVENAAEAIVVLDADAGRFVDANDNALALFGVTREKLMTLDPGAVSPPEQPCGRSSRDMAGELVARAVAGERVMFEWTHRTADGRDVPTEIRLVRLPSSSRRLVRGSITDISERLAAQQALLTKSGQLEATLENTDQGISMVDAELTMVAFNQRFLELLEFPPERFSPGDPFEKFIRYNAERGEYGPGDVEAQVRERVALAARAEHHRFTRTRPDGTVLEIRGRPLPGGGFVTTYTDITETHRLSQQLSHQARHDALTDLLNRREFERQLARLLDSARDGRVEHALCYLDLDQFKVINDTCGHLAGDELLRQLGATLRAQVRRADVLARLGGDEFGVLLEDCSLDEAQRVASVLRSAVEEFRFSWEDKSFRVGVSIGLVPVTAASGTEADLLSAADAACYAAKDQGRNRIHLYTEDDADLASRQGEMHWVVRLQHALEEDRLCLEQQPIVALDPARGGEAHYELLVRMRGEDGALIPPGQFLPAAERYNLTGRLDRWVVRHAFAALAGSPVRAAGSDVCSINLSGHSLGDDEFLAFVIEEFERSGVAPGRIVFEVTETAAISNLARASRFMGALKDIGCRFALDDFGSGLSSFGYLKTLPVDFLKIDGMFVKDILVDPIDHAMVKCINEIGHVMGKRTIAEFVENDAVRERLAALGVDYVQGYGVGRPVPFPSAGALRKAS